MANREAIQAPVEDPLAVGQLAPVLSLSIGVLHCCLRPVTQSHVELL